MRLVLLSTALAVFVPTLLWAQPVPVGPEFQVNTVTTYAQRRPSVAADTSGNFVVVWQSLAQDGSLYGIFGQRFDNTGSPQGPEFEVNTYTPGSQRSASVAVDTSGNFVVVWASYEQDDSFGYGIFGQRFDSTGGSQGTEFQVNTYETSYQMAPSVAVDTSGNFVVVWQSYAQDDSHYGIFGQLFDNTGSPQGLEFQVNTYTTGSQSSATVAVDTSGNFVVVWQSEQDGSADGVFGQRFDNTGSPQGPEFQVNTFTTSYQNAPSVAVDTSGNFVVVWQGSGGQDDSSYGVFGQRFDNTGSPQGPEFQVNTFTTSYQNAPSVVVDSSGNFVVVWQSLFQDGSAYGVFGQRFDNTGSPRGPEFQVNTYTTNYQDAPSVAVDAAGNFVVVWRSLFQDGSGFGVFGQRFLPCSNPVVDQVSGLHVDTANDGADLFFTWIDLAVADDYVVFEDTAPDGGFSTETGTAMSGGGMDGLTVPVPPGDIVYFLVAGRNSSCGVGPKQ